MLVMSSSSHDTNTPSSSSAGSSPYTSDQSGSVDRILLPKFQQHSHMFRHDKTSRQDYERQKRERGCKGTRDLSFLGMRPSRLETEPSQKFSVSAEPDERLSSAEY